MSSGWVYKKIAQARGRTLDHSATAPPPIVEGCLLEGNKFP